MWTDKSIAQTASITAKLFTVYKNTKLFVKKIGIISLPFVNQGNVEDSVIMNTTRLKGDDSENEW